MPSAKVQAKEPHNLKSALRAGAQNSSLTIKQQADVLGVKVHTLYGWIDESNEDLPPMRRLPAILQSQDDTTVLDYLESLKGRVAYTLPTGSNAADVHLADTVRRFGEFIVEHTSTHADSIVTPDEDDRLRARGNEAIACILALMDHARIQSTRADERQTPRLHKRSA